MPINEGARGSVGLSGPAPPFFSIFLSEKVHNWPNWSLGMRACTVGGRVDTDFASRTKSSSLSAAGEILKTLVSTDFFVKCVRVQLLKI